MRSSRKSASNPNLVVEKSAGAVVFSRRAGLKYLLILSTYWEFPKGQVEPDESETKAALREVREETGLAVELVADFRQEITYWYRRSGKRIKKQVAYFLGEAPTQEVTLSLEHREAKWLPFERAMSVLKYESAREILRRANDWLTSGHKTK